MPVTLETRQLFGLADIRSMQIVCQRGGAVAFFVGTQFPLHCPNFNKGWYQNEKLLFDIAYKIVQRKDEPSARLVFEIDAPKCGKGSFVKSNG